MIRLKNKNQKTGSGKRITRATVYKEEAVVKDPMHRSGVTQTTAQQASLTSKNDNWVLVLPYNESNFAGLHPLMDKDYAVVIPNKDVFLTASSTSLEEIIKEQKREFHKNNDRLLNRLEEIMC